MGKKKSSILLKDHQLDFKVSETAGLQWPYWLKELKGTIYHSREWGETQSSRYRKPLFFSWFDKDESCLGIALGIKSWSRVPFFGHLIKRLDFESYPVVREGNYDLTRFFIKYLIEFAAKGGYRAITIQSFYANELIPDMDHWGLLTTPRIEFIMNLTLSRDKLWKGLSSHHRRKIKKAKAKGLNLGEVRTFDGMRDLINLIKSSRDRRVGRGEEMDEVNDQYYYEVGKKYFENDLGRVFLMTYGKEIVSGAFVTIYAGKAIYVYGGSSDTGFNLDAPALLFWEVFHRCRDLKCTEFNLGGVPAFAENSNSKSYGLYRFKNGFGGKQVKCLSGSIEDLNSGWNLVFGKATTT